MVPQTAPEWPLTHGFIPWPSGWWSTCSGLMMGWRSEWIRRLFCSSAPPLLLLLHLPLLHPPPPPLLFLAAHKLPSLFLFSWGTEESSRKSSSLRHCLFVFIVVFIRAWTEHGRQVSSNENFSRSSQQVTVFFINFMDEVVGSGRSVMSSGCSGRLSVCVCVCV